MTIPFYKLQLAGNGFILVDLDSQAAKGEALTADRYGEAARQLCDRRFGVGGTGAIFLSRDNAIRVFNDRGQASTEADDALLCAARYAFDSGRVSGRQLVFHAARGDRTLDILGSHEFRSVAGTPFALPSGRVIDPSAEVPSGELDVDGVRARCSVIHLHDDVAITFAHSLGTLNYSGYEALIRKAFPQKPPIPVIARALTRDSLIIRARLRRESGACAAAAAALTTAVCSGMADHEALVMFDQADAEGQPDSLIALDTNLTRRLAVSWDKANNELSVIGSGSYVFDGNFDLINNR